ncbi:hypothetical protein EXN66_Car017717 [Channa argus]|uniref:Uncharacterized protein n=1 Tax=Channa argus TaxID=215402 RepID=A0A6G1QI11_CHAAH|nr:hypothetical protein EXN66_Car017717 [Channa argus]
MVVGARQGVQQLLNLLIYCQFHAQPSLGFTEDALEKKNIFSELQFSGLKFLVDSRGQRRRARLVQLYSNNPLLQLWYTEVCL